MTGERAGEHVRVSVEDAGPGVADPDRGSIFERFYRASDQEPEPRGLGLGLWIVKSIVDRHGGSVSAERTADGRTRFIVSLPIAGVAIMKILVVDDDADLLALVGFALTQAGYAVVKAADVRTALQAFAAEAPDLAVLDINLPDGTGFGICEAIREQSRIPVMMLTARGEEEDLVKALELGADDYLTKPFSPRTLLARVKALLRRAGLETGGAMSAGRLSLDLEAHSLRVGDAAPVKLTKLETRLLQILIANAGHVVSTERLLTHVWGHRGSGDRQLLKQLVHRLRQKIEADPSEPHTCRRSRAPATGLTRRTSSGRTHAPLPAPPTEHRDHGDGALPCRRPRAQDSGVGGRSRPRSSLAVCEASDAHQVSAIVGERRPGSGARPT